MAELTVLVNRELSQQTYNSLGQRAIKTSGATRRLFIYGHQGELLAEFDGQGAALREHIYLHNEVIAQVHYDSSGADTLFYVHNNHLGTPQLVTDAAQQVVWSVNYRPFGETDISSNGIDNPIRFPGQYEDQETGLYYNYFRYYDPSTGRYITSDNPLASLLATSC